jgi:hypothetical protein
MRVLIRHVREFGKRSDIAVHQVVDCIDDACNAADNADRDGFELVVLYVHDAGDGEFYCNEVCSLLPDAEINLRVLDVA